MPIRAKIVAPDGAEENRREILCEDPAEYNNQLPLNIFPITHLVRPEGIGVVLTDGHYECEASFHRFGEDCSFGEHFYIGSAYKRLGSREYTKRFRRFLEIAGIVDNGTLVSLEFKQHTIHIFRI